MNKDDIIKQNKRCIEILKRKQMERIQEINESIVEIDFKKAILEKELHIMLIEQDIRTLEAEKRELERYLASQ
jgi:hypothetical protein